jgi:hypothetical protein
MHHDHAWWHRLRERPIDSPFGPSLHAYTRACASCAVFYSIESIEPIESSLEGLHRSSLLTNNPIDCTHAQQAGDFRRAWRKQVVVSARLPGPGHAV